MSCTRPTLPCTRHLSSNLDTSLHSPIYGTSGGMLPAVDRRQVLFDDGRHVKTVCDALSRSGCSSYWCWSLCSSWSTSDSINQLRTATFKAMMVRGHTPPFPPTHSCAMAVIGGPWPTTSCVCVRFIQAISYHHWEINNHVVRGR